MFCAALKDESEYGGYFPFDLPMDGFRRFFPLRRQRVFDRPRLADLFIRLDQSPAEFPILPELCYLPFGFALRDPPRFFPPKIINQPVERAIDEIWKILEPNGFLAATSPFRLIWHWKRLQCTKRCKIMCDGGIHLQCLRLAESVDTICD